MKIKKNQNPNQIQNLNQIQIQNQNLILPDPAPGIQIEKDTQITEIEDRTNPTIDFQNQINALIAKKKVILLKIAQSQKNLENLILVVDLDQEEVVIEIETLMKEEETTEAAAVEVDLIVTTVEEKVI